jgi:hypothetical protein
MKDMQEITTSNGKHLTIEYGPVTTVRRVKRSNSAYDELRSMLSEIPDGKSLVIDCADTNEARRLRDAAKYHTRTALGFVLKSAMYPQADGTIKLYLQPKPE